MHPTAILVIGLFAAAAVASAVCFVLECRYGSAAGGFRCLTGRHNPFTYRTEDERRLNIFDCARCGKRYFGRPS